MSASQLLRRVRRTIELDLMLVPREVRVRYRRSFLDAGWALITPIALLAVYGAVLTSFGATATCGPYISTAWIGLVIWTFFATATSGGVTSLVGSADLISKLYFPREALPLAMVGAALVDLGIGVATIAPLVLVQGVDPTITWVAFPIAVLVAVVWAAAISVIVATVAAFVRDLVHLVNLLLRVGFFAVPVMYEASALPSQLAWTATANPLAVAITASRESLLCGQWPSFGLLGLHLVAGLAVLALGIVYTASVESRITDVI